MPEQGRDGQQPARRKIRFPDELKTRCMLLLQLRHDRHLDRPDDQVISAALLGRALKHWPNVKRETLRRRVRELVNEMWHEGAPIASGGGGYWIAKTVEDFKKTEAFLRSHGIAELTTSANIKQSAARDRAVGQLRFAPYHSLVTGQSALALYLKPGQSPGLSTDPSAADHSDAVAHTAEQSAQPWADSLFATT